MTCSLPRMHLGLKFCSAHMDCNINPWGGRIVGRFIVTFAMAKHHDGEQLVEKIVPEGKSPPWPGGMAAGSLSKSWLTASQHTGSRERLPTPSGAPPQARLLTLKQHHQLGTKSSNA